MSWAASGGTDHAGASLRRGESGFPALPTHPPPSFIRPCVCVLGLGFIIVATGQTLGAGEWPTLCNSRFTPESPDSDIP